MYLKTFMLLIFVCFLNITTTTSTSEMQCLTGSSSVVLTFTCFCCVFLKKVQNNTQERLENIRMMMSHRRVNEVKHTNNCR